MFKLRVTPHKLKANNHCPPDVWLAIEEVLDKSKPYIMTYETSAKRVEHLHFVGTSQEIQPLREFLKRCFNSRGYALNYYTDDELLDKPPEYYLGYIVKENNPRVIQTNLTNEQILNCRDIYLRSKKKTTEAFIKWVSSHYTSTEYNEDTLINLILDWHKHNLSGFDGIILRREFHLARLFLFESLERAAALANKNNIVCY